jgi:hypothetical protein
MNSKLVLGIVAIALVTLACGTTSTNTIQTAIAQTQAAQPIQPAQPTQPATPTQPVATLPPTATATSTEVPTATNTLAPSPTATATSVSVNVEALRNAFEKNGYGSYSYEDKALRPNVAGTMFYKDNPYNQVIIYKDGFTRLQALSGKDASARARQMEAHFQVLDTVYPASFMKELRSAFETYNNASTGRISGTADKTWALGDAWRNVYAMYNKSSATVGGMPVNLYLWFWQISCPQGYICWMTDFPGEVFVGDNSYTFVEVQFTTTP